MINSKTKIVISLNMVCDGWLIKNINDECVIVSLMKSQTIRNSDLAVIKNKTECILYEMVVTDKYGVTNIVKMLSTNEIQITTDDHGKIAFNMNKKTNSGLFNIFIDNILFSVLSDELTLVKNTVISKPITNKIGYEDLQDVCNINIIQHNDIYNFDTMTLNDMSTDDINIMLNDAIEKEEYEIAKDIHDYLKAADKSNMFRYKVWEFLK